MLDNERVIIIVKTTFIKIGHPKQQHFKDCIYNYAPNVPKFSRSHNFFTVNLQCKLNRPTFADVIVYIFTH